MVPELLPYVYKIGALVLLWYVAIPFAAMALAPVVWAFSVTISEPEDRD